MSGIGPRMRLAAPIPGRGRLDMAKILIVDDERDIVLVLRTLLTSNGYEVREASNGLAGLKMFQSQFFDLVITDLRMPTMDGMSFLREVKQLDPVTPVIILTAYTSLETAAEARERGALIYMGKPFQIDELLSVVNRAVSKNKGTAAALA